MEVAAKSKKKKKEELPSMEVTEKDLENINETLNEFGRKRSSVMNILHEMQDEYHYLPKELLEIVSRELEIPYNQVFGLGTFYDAFFMKPLGDYRIDTCMGTTCYNEGAPEILSALEDYLGVEQGDTRDDGLFTLLDVHCIGCCSIAPALRIDTENGEEVHGYLTPEKAVDIVKEIEEKEKIEVTDELIEDVLEYIKEKEGKIEIPTAAEDLNLKEKQLESVIDEMEERGIIKKGG